jgi:hypothetical protein
MKKLCTLIGAVLLSMNVNAQTTLKVESFRMGIGEQKTITLDMDNSDLTDAAAFCCDIYLPEGVEIATNEEGTYQFSVSDKDSRAASPESLVIASAKQSDGAVRVVCFPQDASAFVGESGAILNVPLVASKELTKGTVEVSVASQEITNTTGLSIVKPEASISDLIAFLRGDVNDDNEINVGDLVSVSNFMAGDESVSKVDSDANEDEEVNVGDMVTITNIMASN